MFGLFKKIEPVEIDGVGTLAFKDSSWDANFQLDDREIEISFDGDESGPDEFAISYYLKMKPKLSDSWKLAKEFTLVKLNEMSAPWGVNDSQFSLKGIVFHRENSFDKGHLSFWFDIIEDSNGSYYVSFVDEKPNYLHRDS
ncbi:hypothetical protein [Pleionea sp. CnH1-48]|uniref:hypothetical protein n=1 Tax=Pleionea sp. CnH1-48 TaxID=2954494 RepID=UPI0020981BE8|nr:hypothetical protein [Pleionea sp. CnH1-48]MCO7222727.1 hypothetical protein [Pleionea sp. CnH1-48]